MEHRLKAVVISSCGPALEKSEGPSELTLCVLTACQYSGLWATDPSFVV